MANKYAEHGKWRVARGCTRKKKYESLDDARAAAERRVTWRGLRKMSYYKCQFCDGYHLTGKERE